MQWFTTYTKNYRDALAHRIPLYVPPSGLTPADRAKYSELEAQIAQKMESRDLEAAGALLEEQAKLGTILPAFKHSYGDHDAAEAIAFHPQLIADMNTVVEIVRVVATPPSQRKVDG